MTQKKDTPHTDTSAKPSRGNAAPSKQESAPRSASTTSHHSSKNAPLIAGLAIAAIVAGFLLVESGLLDKMLGTQPAAPIYASTTDFTPPSPASDTATERLDATDTQPAIDNSDSVVTIAPRIVEDSHDLTSKVQRRRQVTTSAATDSASTATATDASTPATAEVQRIERTLSALQQQAEALTRTVESLRDEARKQHDTLSAPSQTNNAAQMRLEAQVAQLSQQLEALKTAHEQSQHHYNARLALIQAVDVISTKIQQGESYVAPMQRLRRLFAASNLDDDALATLGDHAKEGAPSLADLLDSFHEHRDIVLPVSIAAKDAPSFTDTLRLRLSHIVSIRRVDAEPTDDSDEAHLTRAEAELQSGNVEMALLHVEQLSDLPRELFLPWRQQASSYLAANKALSRLRNLVLQPLADSTTATEEE